MINLGSSFELFQQVSRGKKMVAFAASFFLQLMAENYSELHLDACIEYIVDNDKNKHGTKFRICNSYKEVYSIEHLLADDLENVAILIGSDKNVYDIFQQLENIDILKNVPFFALPFMISKARDDDAFKFRDSGLNHDQIPKKIHCFWLGGGELNDMAKLCLNSFEKYCPDYEICLWTHKNYDVSKNEYMFEAYKSKKWACATDYARLDKLYNEGGIYFDLDVELMSNIDVVLNNDFFTGFGPIRDIELAAFGCKKGNVLVGEMLDAYQDRKFVMDRGLTLMDVQPVFMDHFLKDKGFTINGKYQQINNCTLYPREVFSPRNWFTGEEKIEKNTLGIHHCAGSWAAPKDKESNLQRIRFFKMLEERN